MADQKVRTPEKSEEVPLHSPGGLVQAGGYMLKKNMVDMSYDAIQAQKARDAATEKTLSRYRGREYQYTEDSDAKDEK